MSMLLSAMVATSLQTTVPCVDLQEFVHGSFEQKKQFVESFGKALEQDGCVAIQNSGISEELLQKTLYEAKSYFRLPNEVKMKAYTGNGLQGYVPFQQEHAKNYSVGDLKEYFHIQGRATLEKLWPQRKQFQEVMLSFYDACDGCVHELLVAVALYLRCQDKRILSDLLGKGNNILRILHYPPVDKSLAAKGAVRSHEHEDINLLTIMPKASAPGLQIKTKQGKWIDVIVPDNTIIVTPSEVLGHITSQKIKATTHRVINPPDSDASERYSFPFFASPHMETMIPILDIGPKSFVKGYILHRELLEKRLKEIGSRK